MAFFNTSFITLEVERGNDGKSSRNLSVQSVRHTKTAAIFSLSLLASVCIFCTFRFIFGRYPPISETARSSLYMTFNFLQLVGFAFANLPNLNCLLFLLPLIANLNHICTYHILSNLHLRGKKERKVKNSIVSHLNNGTYTSQTQPI